MKYIIALNSYEVPIPYQLLSSKSLRLEATETPRNFNANSAPLQKRIFSAIRPDSSTS